MAKALKQGIHNGKISPDKIFDELVRSKYFDNIFAELLKDLRETTSYKRLRDIGLQVNLDRTPDSCNIPTDLNEPNKKQSSEIGVLALSIDSAISQHIRRKLKNECCLVIRNKVKEISSNKNKNISASSSNFNANKVARKTNAEFNMPCSINFQNDTSFSVQSKNGSKIYDKLKSMSLGSAQNLQDINVFMTEVIKEEYDSDAASGKEVSTTLLPAKNQTSNCDPIRNKTLANKDLTVSNMYHRFQVGSSFTKTKGKTLNKRMGTKDNYFNKEISNIVACVEDKDTGSDAESDMSIGDLSVGSLSSVHTSDLSSFDDEISLGSDDELGIKRKRRISLKVAKEWCLKNAFPFKETDVATKNKDRTSHSQSSSSRPISSVNKSAAIACSTPRKSLPQRIRKPNLKYISDCISPLSKNSLLHINMLVNSNSIPVNKTRKHSELSKKRGRPRKEISSNHNGSMQIHPDSFVSTSLEAATSDAFIKEEIDSEDEVPSLRMERNAMKIYELTELYPRLPESNV